MFPPTRIQLLKFAAAGAFVVALSAANTPASADEMVQNLGPVGPYDGILATIGSMRVVAFFEPASGRCAVNAVVWDNLGADPGKSAKRVRVSIDAVNLKLTRRARISLSSAVAAASCGHRHRQPPLASSPSHRDNLLPGLLTGSPSGAKLTRLSPCSCRPSQVSLTPAASMGVT
jgi:hypothetical protein